MATLRNERYLADINGNNQQDSSGKKQPRNSVVPVIQEDYITPVSEKTAGRMAKNLSQEFSKTDSRTMRALSKLYELPLNPLSRAQCGIGSGTYRNPDAENREPKEDRSQNDPRPNVGSFIYRLLQAVNLDLKKASDSHKLPGIRSKTLSICSQCKEKIALSGWLSSHNIPLANHQI